MLKGEKREVGGGKGGRRGEAAEGVEGEKL